MAGFEDILGNDLIKKQFSDAISHDSVAHAYLLVGEKGIGKKMMAEAFVLDLFCKNRNAAGHACMTCPDCKKVLAHCHPDMIEIKSETTSQVSIDDAREQIIKTAEIRPYSEPYKVYIVSDADKLNPQTQNALLKTLEEPPAFVVLILLANDERGILPTVLSRVVRIKMKPCTDGQIRKYLTDTYHEEEGRIDVCVAFARGNLGKAIRLLTSEDFANWYHMVMKLCRRIKHLDGTEILMEAKALLSACPEMDDALDLIQLWYRDLMMYKVTKDMNGLVFRNERSALMDLASISSYEGIEAIMDAIETCRVRLSANVNPELALELLFLNMKEK